MENDRDETTKTGSSATLYHISDLPNIERFDPRPSPPNPYALPGEMVWAVDAAHLHNYLLPRDCPRVTFFATDESDPADTDRLLCGTTAKYGVAIESGWLKRVQEQTLYRYDFAPDTFTLVDAGAGYYYSREAVVPLFVTPLTDLLAELLAYDVEMRVMPSLVKLYETVIASTLQFSIIRWRNAAQSTQS